MYNRMATDPLNRQAPIAKASVIRSIKASRRVAANQGRIVQSEVGEFANSLKIMAPQVGLEPTTLRLTD
jgi:hypothetical protein